MRRPIGALILLVVALVLSACAASEPPGWTFAPPTPSPTPGPSVSGAPSAAPSAGASGTASGAPSGGPAASGTVLDVTAQNIDFVQKQVSAPANSAFTIHFDNQDASVPHDISIKNSTGTAVFTGDLVTGVAQKDYSVPALPAGTYTFVCTVHSNMTGTLTVGP